MGCARQCPLVRAEHGLHFRSSCVALLGDEWGVDLRIYRGLAGALRLSGARSVTHFAAATFFSHSAIVPSAAGTTGPEKPGSAFSSATAFRLWLAEGTISESVVPLERVFSAATTSGKSRVADT